MLAFGIIPIENIATKNLGEKCRSSIHALFGVVGRLEHCVFTVPVSGMSKGRMLLLALTLHVLIHSIIFRSIY